MHHTTYSVRVLGPKGEIVARHLAYGIEGARARLADLWPHAQALGLRAAIWSTRGELVEPINGAKPSPPAWGSFEPATLPPDAFDVELQMQRLKIDRESAQHLIDGMMAESVVMNERYQVNMREVGQPFGPDIGAIRWLSIKRIDKASVHDWRDLQRIKSEIVGPECEAFELYPAESRVVDTANQYHLWVIVDPSVRLPVGFPSRLVTEDAALVGAVQRPL